MGRSCLVLLAASLALGVPGGARAQYNPLTPAQSYMGMARAAMLRNIGRDALRHSGPEAFRGSAATRSTGAAPRPAQPQVDDAPIAAIFAFDPNPEVSARVRARLIAAVANADPAQRAAAEQAFGDGGILKEYARLLASFGYSTHNFLDVYTGFVVISWEVVNGQDAAAHPAGIRAAHAQIALALASNPAIAALPKDIEQDTAEVLSYQAALAGGAKNELVRRGDTAGLARLRESVAATAEAAGIDVRALRLTDQGFVRAD